jgi:hypothetical protein
MKKPKLTLLKGDTMNADNVGKLYKALTGKDMTEEEQLRAQKMFAKD